MTFILLPIGKSVGLLMSVSVEMSVGGVIVSINSLLTNPPLNASSKLHGSKIPS
jgi:hypothetical protein